MTDFKKSKAANTTETRNIKDMAQYWKYVRSRSNNV